MPKTKTKISEWRERFRKIRCKYYSCEMCEEFIQDLLTEVLEDVRLEKKEPVFGGIKHPSYLIMSKENKIYNQAAGENNQKINKLKKEINCKK